MIVKNVEKKENNTAVFQVESDAAEFEAAVNGAYLKNKASIYIPGFRKGKAPRAVVEGMYGKDVFYQDAMDELAPQAFEQGVKEAELRFVGAPSITDVNVTDERTAAYTFTVTLYPEVTLGQYKGIEATREPVSVSDEDVNAEVESARKRNARKVSVEREAQMGDTANIDFDGFLNGERFDGGKAEGYDLELGSNSFVPGFEEQIVGMQIGEEKDLDITFPEEYVEDLAGKAVVFKVKLNSLTVSELPELDDEFAKDVSEFDTLDELKADIRKNLEERRNTQADAEVENALMAKVVEGMQGDIPEVMYDNRCQELAREYEIRLQQNGLKLDQYMKYTGQTMEQLLATFKPEAEKQVKTRLALEAIVAKEQITASDEDAEAEIKKIADAYKMEVDAVKGLINVEDIKKDLAANKALDFVKEKANIKVENVTDEKAN